MELLRIGDDAVNLARLSRVLGVFADDPARPVELVLGDDRATLGPEASAAFRRFVTQHCTVRDVDATSPAVSRGRMVEGPGDVAPRGKAESRR